MSPSPATRMCSVRSTLSQLYFIPSGITGAVDEASSLAHCVIATRDCGSPDRVESDWMHETARCFGYPSDKTRTAREQAWEATRGHLRRRPGPVRPGPVLLHAPSQAVRLILVDTATQAQARDLTTLAFIDVRRADAPAILHHATTTATTQAKTSSTTNRHNVAARAILKAIRKTLRIERNAAKAARKAVAIAAHLLDRLADTEVEEEEEEETRSVASPSPSP